MTELPTTGVLPPVLYSPSLSPGGSQSVRWSMGSAQGTPTHERNDERSPSQCGAVAGGPSRCCSSASGSNQASGGRGAPAPRRGRTLPLPPAQNIWFPGTPERGVCVWGGFLIASHPQSSPLVKLTDAIHAPLSNWHAAPVCTWPRPPRSQAELGPQVQPAWQSGCRSVKTPE